MYDMLVVIVNRNHAFSCGCLFTWDVFLVFINEHW